MPHGKVREQLAGPEVVRPERTISANTFRTACCARAAVQVSGGGSQTGEKARKRVGS